LPFWLFLNKYPAEAYQKQKKILLKNLSKLALKAIQEIKKNKD